MQENPGFDQVDIAVRLGIDLEVVAEAVGSLMEDGLIAPKDVQ